jgi:cytochrome P450
MTILLLILGAFTAYKLSQKALSFKTTSPEITDYLSFTKDLMSMHSSKENQGQLQARFMNFIVQLGKRSLSEGTGVGHFRLPNLTQVFALSNREVIKKFYEGNTYIGANQTRQIRFGQKKFFNHLAVILGPDNFMSSDLGTSHHSAARAAILSRNEAFRPKVANFALQYFEAYAKTKQGRSLSEVMDTLSRQVLIATYFDPSIINQFEALYDPALTQKLVSSIFSLNPVGPAEREYLLKLREEIFELGTKLIFSTPQTKQGLLNETSWLNQLLKMKILNNEAFQDELEPFHLDGTITRDQCEQLIRYALANRDDTPLSAAIRTAVDESLLIPLLGFDATATALLTTLRIIIQDRRIYTRVMEEIQEKHARGEAFELHSPWDIGKNGELTYTEAVIMEALRLVPPVPMIPEMINETFSVQVNGKPLTFPAGAMVFIPLQNTHTDAQHFPDIPLSAKGQELLGKPVITANDIFPERWLPQKEGKIYNTDLFAEGTVSETASSVNPSELQRDGGLLTFKTGSRRCPGLRIALTEILSLVKMFNFFKFELTGEEELSFNLKYETALSRNGGKSILSITPIEASQAATPVISTVDSESSFSAGKASAFFKAEPKETIMPPVSEISVVSTADPNSSFSASRERAFFKPEPKETIVSSVVLKASSGTQIHP